MDKGKDRTNVSYGPGLRSFMDQVKKTLVQQPDYTGMSGHGVEDHGGHGKHTQTSIGLGNRTVNFREFK